METFAKEFEQFIISGFRDESLVSLIPGGISEQYFNLCKRINDFENEDHEALYRDIKTYEQKDSSQETGGRLILLYLMKKFDSETQEEKKKEILEKLNSKYKIFQNKDFPKPRQFSQFNTNIETNEKFSSVLNEEIFNYDKILNKIYQEKIIEESSVEELDEKSLHIIIDLTRLTDTALLDLLERNLSHPLRNCLQKIYFYHHDSKLLEKIAHIMKLPEYVSHGRASLYMQGIHTNMTTSQIEKFMSLVPKDFPKDYMINELISRKFTSGLKRAKDDFTKRKILLEIYEFLKEKPLKYNSMKSDNILLILENGLQTNCYDVDLFKQFLENPIDISNNQYKLYEKKLQKLIQDNSVRQTICNIQNKSANEEKTIIQKYLKHFFVFEGKTIDEFAPFLQTDYLAKEYYTCLLLRGEEDDKIINFLSNSIYEALIKSVDIKICEHNKELFKVDEAFEIELDIKNVQTLFVKTFEINTENYYYKNLDTINSAISLEGLIATYEETYSFSDKPQKLVRRNFKFEKIPFKRGIYIIEFIGNGYSSRAVIKKGSLSLVSKYTPNGKIFYILDEAQNICRGEKTGIWVKKEFYKSDLNSGAIIIPYQRSVSTEKAILIDQDFAEITELTLDTEQYRLEASYIYNKESFLMGNVTKLLIKPFLFVNNRLIDTKFLNNIKITVNLIKLENGQEIPITTVFDNSAQFREKLLNKEEIEVEFQIPPRLTNITIILEAVVENKSQEIKNILSSRKIISVNAKDPFPNSYSTNSNNYFKLFLRKFDKKYQVTLLCKNGEPQANVDIKFNFILSTAKITDITLKTNEKGDVCLGRLEHVQMVLAESTCIGGVLRDIFYLKSSNHIGYPSTIDLIEGEDIQLPIIDEDINTMYFFTLEENKVIENLTGRIKISLYKNDQISSGVYNKYKTLMIKELREGTYKLGIESTEIIVNVHKGKYWQSEQYIITENKIIEKNSNKSPIHLEKFEVDNLFNLEEGEISQKVKIKVSSNTFNPRVHLFAYQFVNNIEGISSAEIAKITQQALSGNFYFAQWKNMFMSNRLLNEEIQYVLDRKHYERYMGNSLDKPSLLVKRQFVRDTTTDIIEAKQGTNFERLQPNVMKAQECRLNNVLSCKYEKQSAVFSQDIRKTLDENASTFHNFLACSPLILTNLKPDEEGEISIGISLKDYTVLHALVIDDKGAYEDSLYLPYEKFQKRDLRMSKSVDHDKNFSEIRKTSLIHKGGSHSILDITSTSYQIIDSIEKYLSYVMLSTQSNIVKKDFNDLSFLVKFEQLDEKEKLKKLSNYFCHEVNIYLFFKHHEFFLKNVRNVLCYKTEKSFVDFFLLQDLTKIKEFTGPNRISTLNSFEKCLLIYAIRKESPELAKTIAKNLRNDSEALKISADETKKLFNIIINMKIDNELPKSEEMKSSFPKPEEMKSSYMALKGVNLCAMNHAPKMAMKRATLRRKEDELFDISEAQITAVNIKNNITSIGGKSKEYCENHYYNTNSKDSKSFILANGFYADLAEYWAHDLDNSKGFLSPNIILPINSIAQLITTISVLDFPSTRTITHSYNRLEGRGLEIVANSNGIVFTKEISETTADIRSNLMIAQITNKSIVENKDDDVEQLTDEEERGIEDIQANNQKYLVNQTYKHETIVTNVSNKTLTFELLINVPEGALPVHGSDYTSTVNLSLLKFKTTKIETFFYFSKPGKFMQTAPSASIEGVVIAKTEPMLYEVYETIAKQSLCTLDDVLESGTKKEILEFLNKNDNLSNENLSKIFWLLNDEEFYRELIKILKSKGIYNKTIWSFSFKHHDHTTLREYLEADTQLKSILGPKSDFELIKVASHNNYNIMNHLDYHPILNARVNRVGQNKSSSILNKEFRATYEAFVNYLISLDEIDAKSYLRLSYYLILQDRIEDAFKIFQRIDPNIFNSLDSYMLQYDYISAYIDFSMGYPEFSVAREICEKYKNFPLKRWRELFEEIEDQLQEYDGKQSYNDIDQIIDEEKKTKHAMKIASETEPKLNFSVENKNLNILYTSINSITIKFYLIDLEILFSRTPFIQQNSDDFSFVQPNFIQIIQVESSAKENILISPIPSKYINSNLFIEVSSSSKKVFNTHYSTSLLVNISEAIGEIKVLDSNLKPLTKVYVKCFAKHKDDSVKFYKDGYTDLRGRFNYISLNSEAINTIKKFSIFIMHDELGSLIKEANPPSNMESFAPITHDNVMPSSYDNYMNYRQEIKQKLKSQK